MIKLRKHQIRCIEDCIDWIKKSVDPGVVEATVSFGKSVTIAELAKRICDMSGKKVLVLCPSGNLVKQNSKKVRELGYQCSVFSASLNEKSTKHDIVVGTPQSIANRISKFGPHFAAILIDEGDGLTRAIIDICENIKKHNPLARIIGFTGTPWTTQKGFIYRIDNNGSVLGDDLAREPFYLKCIHKTRTPEMLEDGYLTPVVIGSINAERYETRGLIANSIGQFKKEDVDRAYHGHGRKTSLIIDDVVRQSAGKEGVLIFGATLQHCEEIMASLPPSMARMVASGKKDNQKNLEDFKAKKYKYLVNKDMVTIGADFPHVDVLAILRKSSSSRLLTQIIGRGMRIHENTWDIEPETAAERRKAIANGPKPFCLYLDYTEDNMDEHFPDGDLFAPIIVAKKAKDKDAKPIRAKCEKCGYGNEFSANKDYVDYPIDEYGYCIDVFGSRIETDYGPLSAHHGRRCQGFVQVGKELERCDYYWTSKICECCNCKNDVAARYCRECKAELVDPGAKLLFEFKAMKRDPHLPQCDDVLSMECKPTISRSGRETLRVDWVTPHRQFSTWFFPGSAEHKRFLDVTDNGNVKPATVGYRKVDDKFYKIHSYNLAADEPERVDKFKRVG